MPASPRTKPLVALLIVILAALLFAGAAALWASQRSTLSGSNSTTTLTPVQPTPSLATPPSSPSPAPTTASPTSSATPTAPPSLEPGEQISIPAVPAPRDDSALFAAYTQPDRPAVPIPDVKPPGFIDPPPGAGMTRYTDQAIDWQSCTVSQVAGSCATIAAPLDYTDPDGQAITIALFKVAATASPKLGTIFVNPGGPGGGGRSTAATFDRTNLEAYDIVGWDPRGTGESTPVVCPDGAEVDALFELDNSPDTPEETTALFDAWKQYGQKCLDGSGPLLAHVSTKETVEDLDLLRGLVGDPTLNYLGYSYGTQIGAVYAQTYPGKVGKMVLDSAVNITNDLSVVQAQGFDLALGNYAQWCVDKGRCPLGSSKDQVIAKIDALLRQVDDRPLNVGTRTLNSLLALDGIALYLYFDAKYWQNLTTSIVNAINGNGTALLAAADALWGRDGKGRYDHSFAAFNVISCLDSPDDGIQGAMAAWKENTVKAPIFGKWFGVDSTCPVWPVKAAPIDPTLITAPGAAPIVVVGAVGDSATPYQFAVWMAGQLESGVLVTFAGSGHATYGSGRSDCVDQIVQQYFADNRTIPNGLYCSA